VSLMCGLATERAGAFIFSPELTGQPSRLANGDGRRLSWSQALVVKHGLRGQPRSRGRQARSPASPNPSRSPRQGTSRSTLRCTRAET